MEKLLKMSMWGHSKNVTLEAKLDVLIALYIKSEGYKLGLYSEEDYSKFIRDVEDMFSNVIEMKYE